MNNKFNLKTVSTILLATTLSGGLAGCVEESSLNNSEVEYTPEQRALGVLAGEDGEYAPGSPIVLSGRLTGTVTNETLLWQQTSGSPINIDDPTKAEISFVAPNVDGLEAFTFTLSAIDANGSVVNDKDGNPLVDEVKATVFDPALKVRLEVEDSSVATLSGAISIAAEGDDHYLSGFSGTGATSDMTPGDSVTFKVTLDEAAYYSLYLGYAIPGDYGGKMGKVITNGVEVDVSLSATGQWESLRVGTVSLEAGENTIEVCCGWNYYRIDYVELIPAATPAAPLPVAADLVNANATEEAKSLMEFLTSNYSIATLTGQTEFPAKSGDTFPLTEFNKIVSATGGDAPAIVAFDYMNYSSSYNGSDYDGLTESMIKAHNDKNIIVSALFHWRAPSGNSGANGSFYTKDTTFDVAAALADPNSAEYAELITDIDIVANQLKKLADAGIPVLWRPLHEAQGGWFWWGAQGSGALKELWMLMYDRMTNVHGLNNLIWVFTHTSDLSADWYPGDNYVDIVGYDGYADPANDASVSFSSQYATLKSRHDGKKLIALTETGTIPNVTSMHEQDAWWSFFITWNSETWDSSSLIGPDGAEPATIAANYASEGVLNLDSVPGGRDKVEAGIYESFDISTAGFEGQINWGTQPGITVSSNWAANGANALAYFKDLSAEEGANGVILQTYPASGINVAEVSTLSLNANAINAGANVTIKLWAKDGEGAWRDAGALPLTTEGLALSLDVSDIDVISGFGLQIEGFDSSSTDAQFYLDNVRLDDNVIYDFEPSTSDFEGQVNWSTKPGITATNHWSSKGERSLTYIKNLSMEDGANGVILQTYPTGGIDVADVSMLKVDAQALNTGSSTTVKLWAKDGDGAWRDAGATPLEEQGLSLEIDISDIDTVSGFGLQIEGFDASATHAEFYLDNVRLDDKTLYNFEGTGKWEFQKNWSPAEGIHLAQNWQVDGENSLAGITQLAEGDDNIILQVYPEGGVLLGDVTSLNITAHVEDAGTEVQVQLFAKDQDFAWRDGGAINMIEGGVTLTLDISDLKELSGFGVRFMSPNNTETPAKFYIDSVEFK